MHARMQDFADRHRNFGLLLVVALLAWAVPAQAQALFKVPGTHASIQEAVDACPSTGCVITLSDPLYKLPNTLLIYEKANITIKGAIGIKPVIQFQDKGLLAGPYFTPADKAFQVAGWKQWPINATTAVGGSQNTSNPYSTSGYQQNGVILVKQSSKITFDNLVIDGVAPLPIGHTGIWMPGGYPTLLGNFGINLFLSKDVEIKNTKITNCFAGMYIFGRNKGGAMARNNASDLDKGDLLPNSQFGYTGQHLVDYSELANNIWGVYVESDWDIGSTFHHNLIYSNYNPDFSAWMTAAAGTSTIAAISGNSEAANHAGGFLYGKDFVTVPYKIYNNTFYQNASIFGYGMWRATTQHLFYNNLITNPYFDYNADKTALLTGNYSKYFLQQDLMSKYSDGIYNNTFAIFPAKASLNNVASATSVVLTRSNTVFPMPRLDLQVQTQKLSWNFSSTNYTPPGATTGTYVNLATPVKDSVLYWSQANLQYQSNERNFPYQSWILSTPPVPTAGSIPTKKYTVLGKLFGIAAQAYPAIGVKVGDTIPVMDQPNQQSWTALDSTAVMNLKTTFTDTLGVVLKVSGGGTTAKDISSQTNWFIKSVPFQSLDPKSPKFLEPVWTDPGVDSVVLDHGRWGIDPDGSIVDVGAKSRSKGIPPSINLVDGTQAKYDSIANTIRFSFDLQELGGNFTDYQYYIFTYASSVSDDDNPVTPYNPSQLALTSIISGKPKVGSNSFEAKLTAKPDPRSRYQIMIVAKTATGATVYSNMGTWLYKNDGFDMNVMFFDAVTKEQISTARVGQNVIMRLRPVISRDATIQIADFVKYFCYDSAKTTLKYITTGKDATIKAAEDSAKRSCTGVKKAIVRDTSWIDSLDAGKRTANVYTGTLQVVQVRATGLHDVANANHLVDPTDIFRTNMRGEQDFNVIFTTAGAQIVGANGKDTVGVGGKKAAFSGDGKITIRPGLPYIAQFQDPPSVSLADTGFIAKEAKYPVKISVFDSVGNLVDTASDISLETTAPNGGISVVGGDPVAKTMVLHLDSANGSFFARSHDAVGTVFWLKSKVVARDSARVKVTPPKESLKWTYAAGDSIFRYLGQTAKIKLTLLDGNEQPAISASALPFTAYLTITPGLKLALASKPDSALDSVVIDRTTTASVELVVSSSSIVADGKLTGSNPDLNDPADFTPVTFREPPIPPYPSMDSAALLDSDCDGSLDQVRVFFKKDPTRHLKDSVSVSDVLVQLPGGIQAVVGGKVKILDPDSSVISIPLATPVAGTAPTGSVTVHLLLKRMSLGDTVVTTVVTGKADTILVAVDRMGPRLSPRALIWENTVGNPHDTLRVVVSEPIAFAGTDFPLLVLSNGTWKKPVAKVSKSWFGATHDTLYLDVTGNDGSLVEKAVVRIDPNGGIADLAGNTASDCVSATDTLLAWVKPIPMSASALFDRDGDGAADFVQVRFAAKLTKAAHLADSLVISGWCDACGTRSIKSLTTTDSITFTAQIAPFTKGVTRGKGAQGQGSLTFISPMQNQTVDLADSVGPIPTQAVLRFGQGKDTLKVSFSEAVTSLAAGSWLMHQSGAALALDPVMGSAGNAWSFTVGASASPYPNVGDSVYLPNSGSRLVDQSSVMPTSAVHPPRVVVQGGDRAPDSAWVLDQNGDGTADAVRLFYSKAPVGNPIFRFNWGGASVTMDATKVAGQTDVTLSVAGFPAMTTASANPVGTSQSVVAGEVAPELGFDLKDHVAPVLVSAFVTYGLDENLPDTLRLKMSEGGTLEGAPSSLILSNRKGDIALVRSGEAKMLTANEFILTCKGDSCNLPGFNDEVRLAVGSVHDAAGAIVGDSSLWVKVTTGPKPIRYGAVVYPPRGYVEFSKASENPLRVVDPVSAWIRPEGTSTWKAFGLTADKWTQNGGALSDEQITRAEEHPSGEKIVGIKLDLNTSFDGQFLAFDNLGTFVGKVDLKIDLKSLQDLKLVNGANKYSLLIGLNGLNQNGTALASGPYMIRVISYSDQMVNGQLQRVQQQNKVFTIGVYNRLK